jgi:hypothetical protein
MACCSEHGFGSSDSVTAKDALIPEEVPLPPCEALDKRSTLRIPTVERGQFSH